MIDNETSGVPAEWLEWMREFRVVAERLAHEDAIDVQTPAEAELLSIKLALYARIITVFGTLVLLAEHDLQLDLRIHSRAVIEATMYMIALDADATLVDRMKDDDLKSRRERATLHRDAMPAGSELWKELDGFIKGSTAKLESITARSLVKSSDFARLYSSYRDISGDAAHVSLTSLSRHASDEVEGVRLVLIDPALDRPTMLKTLSDSGISGVIATYLIIKCKEETNIWDEMAAIVGKYSALSAAWSV